jgi:phage repressor protein C with HTH and peptisase S24 domain
MASASEDRRQALRSFMKERGLKAKPWADRAKVADGTLRGFLKGRTDSLTHSTLQKLAEAADATIAEIIGERPPQARPGREIITIQGLNVQAAMGGGVEISDEPAGEPFYFRKSFIDRIGKSRPARLRVIELIGDSMEPTLREGDVALIDLNSLNVMQAPGVYCIWSNTGLAVKRVAALPGTRPKLRIQSDNRTLYDHVDEVDADDVRIIGRVVWRGGTV